MNAHMDEIMEKLHMAATDISKALDCDVLLINAGMDRTTLRILIKTFKDRESEEKLKKNVLFLLITSGGDPSVAYRISRMLQRKYNESYACVSGWCKSAGTLCVIGAKSLYISDMGELGPLDMQVQRQDEIVGMDSGLIVADAFRSLQEQAFSFFETFMLSIVQTGGSIRFKTATEIASTITHGVFEPIYKQIDPNKVGEMARYLAIAEAYGERLNSHKSAQNLRQGALKNLTRSYPAHGFVIDREEAQAKLFSRVYKTCERMNELIDTLGELATVPADRPVILFLNPSTPHQEKENDHVEQSE